jgi:hypothetical protein
MVQAMVQRNWFSLTLPSIAHSKVMMIGWEDDGLIYSLGVIEVW